MSRDTNAARRSRESARISAASRFKENQKVKCVDDSDTRLVTKGMTYEVEKVDRHMLVLKRLNAGFGASQHMYAKRFKPVKGE